MSYFGEFARNRRSLAGAFIGMASGYTINNYINNIFIPALVREFHWRNEDIALVSVAATISIVSQPLAGRLTDRLGVRSVAAFGVLASALIYCAFSVMSGAFWIFACLTIAQIALVASTTAAVVYSRPLAQNFFQARGLALALAICAPSLIGVLAIGPLTAVIDGSGWRMGYRLVAVATLVGGLAAVWLSGCTGDADTKVKHGATAFADIRSLLANGNLRIILAGMALCSLSITFQTTQLKTVLLGAGLSSFGASALVALYALGVIGGRLLSGVALDLLPTRVVAIGAMSLPGIGLLLLGAGTTNPILLHAAMLSIGFSLGAESDIAGYLVSSYLPKSIYSMAYGVVIGSISFAAGCGSLLLGVLLAVTHRFEGFLCAAGSAAIIGGALFSRLPRNPDGIIG